MSNTLDRYLDGTKFTNLSVKANCDNTDDGSIEASGILYINTIKRYNINNNGINIENNTFSSDSVIINSTRNALNSTTASLIVKGGISILQDSILYGNVTINNTIDSISLSSGALVITGGISVQKSTNLNGILSLFNTSSSINATSGSLISYGGISINSTNDATSYTNGGGLTISGGASISKTLYANILNSNLSNILNLTSQSLISNYANITVLTTNNLYNTFASISNLNLINGIIQNTSVSNLNANLSNIEYLNSNLSNINNLTVGNLYVKNIVEYGNAYINSLTSNSLFVTNSSITNGLITNITTNNINSIFSTLGSTQITNGTFSNIYIENQTVGSSFINNSSISNLNTNQIYTSNLLIQSSLSSTNSSTGSVIVIGGISITNTLDSVSLTNGGTLTLSGGASIAKTLYSNIINANNLNTNTILGNTAYFLGLTAGNINFIGDLYKNGQLYVSSQWTLNSTNNSLSYTNGNVGINTINPQSTLDVNGTITTSQDINVKNSINSQNSTSINTTITNLYTLLNTFGSIYINNTLNSTSLSFGGSFTSLGGASILKDVYIGGKLSLNNNIITNVTSPTNSLDVANKYYVDTRFDNFTTGSIYGNFTKGQVIIASTNGNITGYDTFTFNNNLLSIFSTNETANLTTPGSFITYGGANILKNVYIGGKLDVNNNNITSVAVPIRPFDAANKLYVDSLTYGNVNGNFTQGQIIVATTGGNITGYDSFTFNLGLLSINSSINSNNLTTPGSFITYGGANILKDVYIGGKLDVNNNNITNVALPIRPFDAVNKVYVDSLTYGNVSGNFTQGQLLIASTLGNIRSFPGLTFNSGILSINSTTNTTGLTTPGTFISYGGANILKDVYIGGKLDVNNNNITNVALPIQPFDAANKVYVDSLTYGNVSGNFTQGQLLVASTLGNITSFSGLTFNSGILSINSTNDAIGLTSPGSFISYGGANILKDVYIGGKLDVNNNNITSVAGPINASDAVNKQYVDSYLGINTYNIIEQSFTLTNNISIPTDIPGLIFSRYTISSFNAFIYLQIPELNIYSTFEIKGILKGNNWNINTSFIGDICIFINFSITNNGQMQYTNNTLVGTCVIRFKANTLSQGIYNNPTGGNVFIRDVPGGGTGQNYFTNGTLLIGNGIQPIYSQSTLSFYNKTLLISETSEAKNLSSGTLVTLGGISIQKNLIVGQGINVSNKSIINVASPINASDAVNKQYVDSRTIGNINGFFSQGQVLISNSNGSITASSDFTFQNNLLSINSSINSINLTTPGTFITYGGANILKDVYIGGKLDVNNQNITNVGIPLNASDAVNKQYVDSRTIGNLNGSFPQGQVLISSSNGSITASSDFTFQNNLLSINSSINSINLTTPGAFIAYGGANILKDVYIGGKLDVNNQNITNVGIPINPGDATNKKYVDFFLGLSNGDIREKNVMLNNAVNTPQDIIGFKFDNTIVSSFEAIIYLEISTLNIYDQYKISGLLKGNVWEIISTFFGVYPSYINFSISNVNNFGQIQYTNSNISGMAIVRFRATTTSQGIYQNTTIASTFIRDVADGGTGTNYFTSGTLLIGNGASSILTDTNLLFSSGTLILSNTTPSTSLSNNSALITYGGVSIYQNLIVGNGINVNNKNIVNVALPIKPNDAVNKNYVDYFLGINGGDIKETSFVLNNNVTSANIIPNFIFKNTLVSTFKATVCIQIPELNVYSNCEINGILQKNSWVINTTFIGSFQSNINFTISNNPNNYGQINYTNLNTTGTATIIFKATTTSQGNYINLTIGNTFVRDVQDGGTGHDAFSSGCLLIGNASNPILTDSNLNFSNGTLTINKNNLSTTIDSLVILNGNTSLLNLNVNNTIIKNLSSPVNLTDAANKYYVDNSFNSVGNLNASGQLVVTNTMDSNSNITNGALIVLGGVNISKSVYIRGINVTPSLNDIFSEQQFYASNNMPNPQDVQFFIFNNNSTRSFNALCSVTISTLDDTFYAAFTLEGIQITTGWMMNTRFIGNNTHVVFTINNNGQIQYTSNNMPNFKSNLIKFRALTTTV